MTSALAWNVSFPASIRHSPSSRPASLTLRGDLLFSANVTVPNLPVHPLRVYGVVLGGAVQDFVILVGSMRRDGKSLGQMAKEEIIRRAVESAPVLDVGRLVASGCALFALCHLLARRG